jgi:tetratricopeptide (TPR) repeat protein
MPQDTTKGADMAKMELEFAKDPSSRVFIELAAAYMEANRLVEAMVVAKKGLKAHPLEGHLALARVYFKQQKYQKAQEELAQALAADPANIECLVFKGDVHFKAGEEQAGIDAYKKVMEANPAHQQVRAFLISKGVEVPPLLKPRKSEAGPSGIRPSSKKPLHIKRVSSVSTAASSENLSETPEWMRRQAVRRTLILVATLVLVSACILTAIGLYAHKVRKVEKLMKDSALASRTDTFAGYTKARELLRGAVGADESNPNAQAALAYIDAILFGEFGGGDEAAREAAGAIDAAIKAKEPPATTYAAQALLKHYSGDSRGAEGAAMEGFQKFQNNPKVLLALGVIQMASGNYDNALESFKRGRLAETGNDPKNNDPRSLVLMAELSTRHGAARQALSQYELAIKSQPDHAGAILGRAQLFSDFADKLKEAEADARRVLGMPGGSVSRKETARANFILSSIYRSQGSEEEAGKFLSAALQQDAGNAQFHFQLGRKYAAGREFDKARQSFEKAVKIDGKKPEYYRDFADMQIASGDFDGAVQNITRAMIYLADRDKGPFYLLRSKALRLKKDFKEARKEVAKAFALNSEDPYAHHELAMQLRDQGSMDEAAAEAENAAGGFQAGMNPRRESEALVLLASIRMDMKENPEAVEEILLKAIEKDKANAEAYFLMGRLAKSNRKTADKAKEFFQIYLKLAPNGEHAAEAGKGP